MTARRQTDGEGALVPRTRLAEMRELRLMQRETHNELQQARARVKELKGRLEELDHKLGWTIDNLDQPNLPFMEEAN